MDTKVAFNPIRSLFGITLAFAWVVSDFVFVIERFGFNDPYHGGILTGIGVGIGLAVTTNITVNLIHREKMIELQILGLLLLIWIANEAIFYSFGIMFWVRFFLGGSLILALDLVANFFYIKGKEENSSS